MMTSSTSRSHQTKNRRRVARRSKPELHIAAAVCREIMHTIGARPAETGGVLLGPIGSDRITEFYFDHTANCTSGTYEPDHVTMNDLMRSRWLPAQIDWVGSVHSHPPGMDRLSLPDLTYIARQLKANPEMERFAALIVLPDAYRICPYVVNRHAPKRAVQATLILH